MACLVVPLAIAGAKPLTAPKIYVIPPIEIKTAQTAIFDSTSTILAYIEQEAMKMGVDKDMAAYIATQESSLNPKAIGDGNLICKLKKSPNYGKPIRSRGIFQWNDCAHPEVSDKEAFDVATSTALALKEMRAGNARIWSTWRQRKNP